MDKGEYLWRKMWKCQRLANTSNDDLTIRRLMDLAAEYEAKAKAADAAHPPTEAQDQVAD